MLLVYHFSLQVIMISLFLRTVLWNQSSEFVFGVFCKQSLRWFKKKSRKALFLRREIGRYLENENIQQILPILMILCLLFPNGYC